MVFILPNAIDSLLLFLITFEVPNAIVIIELLISFDLPNATFVFPPSILLLAPPINDLSDDFKLFTTP